MQNRTIIENLVSLAKKNFVNILEYFNPTQMHPSLPEIDSSPLDDQYTFTAYQFNQLQLYLRQTSQVLARKFSTPVSTNQNQYRFLRGLWAGHATRTKSTQNMADKFDSLNQVISQLKVRMRGLTEVYNRQKQAVWNEQEIKQILNDHQKHPAFEKISERLSQSSMLSNQLGFKINEIAQQNKKLKDKNNELQSKAVILKEKCRKTQKNMFQITKKKAALEKKLYEYEIGEDSILNSSKISMNSQYFSYMQPHQPNNMNMTISGVKCIQESEVSQNGLQLNNILSESNLNQSRYQNGENKQNHNLKTSLKLNLKKLEQEKQNNQENYREGKEKYRNMKKTSRRTTVSYNNGLNSSFDCQSIKNVKFERKSSKVLLLAKDQKELSKSIRYSQIV